MVVLDSGPRGQNVETAVVPTGRETVKPCEVFVAACVVDATFAARLEAFVATCPVPVVMPQALTASYWASAESALSCPANPVEALVGALLRRADVIAVVGEVEGAEWWWQDVDQDDPPKVFHTDSNVWVKECGSSTQHPTWASVLYLSDDGGPTAVFDGDVAVAVMPQLGRYLLFPGDRLHGVLHSLSDERYERLTLLINWWRRKPPGLSDAPHVAEKDEPLGTTLPEIVCARPDPPSGFGLPSLMALSATPLHIHFAAHFEDWSTQRLPSNLRTAALAPPGWVAASYASPVLL
mmetsp:Transcript_21252/g.59351  ORF Transcript_21252/g.59351 Transcript_21252/m.59351 type:complete len:294 (-) Transcript_21252:34-915(-)